jgi:N-acetylglutamate synthase-like GNAT family acetyltransferase
LRTKFFGLANARGRLGLAAMNEQLWLLQRVVLHPTWRGAGIAAKFVARACDLCPVPWIETLSAMGRVNPFFERAGFTKVGIVRHRDDRPGRFARSEPAYYVRRNRGDGRIPP